MEKKRKHHPKNSFRLRRFRGEHVKLTFTDAKHYVGTMSGQGSHFVHMTNKKALRPSIYVFKSAIRMIELEEIMPEKKLTRKEKSLKGNVKKKQEEETKRVMRRKKGINYD